MLWQLTLCIHTDLICVALRRGCRDVRATARNRAGTAMHWRTCRVQQVRLSSARVPARQTVNGLYV
jgi:hypothetical protein